MPDNIPPPHPNPGFTPRQPGESSSSPGLQDLSHQAEQAAQALSRISELEAAIMARSQQAQAVAVAPPLPPTSMLALQRALESTSVNLASAARTPLARPPVSPAVVAFQQELAAPKPLPVPALPAPPHAPAIPLLAPEAPAGPALVPMPAPLPVQMPPPKPELPELTAENAALLAQFFNKKLSPENLLKGLEAKPPAAPPFPPRPVTPPPRADETAILPPPRPLPIPVAPGQRPLPPVPPPPVPPPPVPLAPLTPMQAQLEEAFHHHEEAQVEAQEEEARRQQETQQEEARRRYEAQHRAAQATYQRLETPLARAAYEDRRRTEMGEETEGYQRQQRAGAIEARLIGRPESQALTAAQVQAMTLAQTNQMRQQAQVAQAQATYAATPEGTQRIQEQLQARQQTLVAQEARQRAEAIAQYGRLSVALGETRERLSSFGGAVSEVAGKGLRFGGVGLGMANVLGGMASPQMAGTVRESASLLGTRMGRSFLPVMEAEARAIQGLDRRYQELEKSSPRAANALTFGLTAAFAAGTFTGFNPLAMLAAGATAATLGATGAFEHGGTGPVEPLTLEQQLRLQQMQAATRQDLQRFWGADFPDVNILPHLGPGGQDDILRSWRGLPQGQTMGGFEYAEMVQQSGLNVSPLQAEQERLQLENVVGLLQQVADNTRNLPNVGPAWR